MAKNSERLWSIDTLRGFDMWFISGGGLLILALADALGAGDGAIARQMHHAQWEGFRHHDTIFPLFLFIAGVTWPFSLARRTADGHGGWKIYRKIILRALILFLFGLSLGGILRFSPTFRIPSVLGFIGISWAIAAVVGMHVRKFSSRCVFVAAVLFGYWALLSFVAAPGSPAGVDTYARQYNIVSFLDRFVMPNHIYKIGVYDPESLFSLPGGVAVAMLGIMAGTLLKSENTAPAKKVLLLISGAAALLLADLFFVFALGDRIVKALWTPSFALSSGVYSVLMLALFYYVVDVLKWRSWTLYFRVIGMNSITVYMAMAVIGFNKATAFFFGGLQKYVGGKWGEAVFAAGYLVVVWAALYFLYRKKIFLKV